MATTRSSSPCGNTVLTRSLFSPAAGGAVAPDLVRVLRCGGVHCTRTVDLVTKTYPVFETDLCADPTVALVTISIV